MLNDYFLVQLSLILVLFFINSSKDIFFSLLNSIIYLGLIAVYSWLDDADILINFLIIIDLGVFFILLAFTLNLTKLFTYNLATTNTHYSLLYFSVFFALIFVFQYLYGSEFCYLIHSNFLKLWSFLLTFYNWYSVFSFVYFTDLQLLSEIYFHFNLLEFIVMNFVIYFTIVLIYFILTLSTLYKSVSTLFYLPVFKQFNKFNNNFFIKSQNLQNQLSTRANLRVWSRSSFKYNDFKANVGQFIR